jgi:hypothetical protein
MNKKSAEILDKLWIEFYMRGEQHEKENRKNALIDRGAVHPEPCGVRLWKDGGRIRHPGNTGGSGRANSGE